jgi:hypothetical protein
MSDLQRPRNLAFSFTATGPRQWKVVGGDRAGTCTFCGGGPTEAVVGCPDEDAPILWQVAVCGECLADTIMWRFAEVKAERVARLAIDLNAASDAIVKERRKFHTEQNRRREAAHYQRLTNAPRRQEDAAERELEEQRRFGETVEQTKARLQADLKAWEKASAQKLVEAELSIRQKYGLLEDTPLDDVTRRGSPLL